VTALQVALLVTVAAGGCYFLFARRRLDAFTVAFFAAVLYFLPGLVGYTLSPVSPRTPVKVPVPLDSEASAIMLAVTGAIVLGAIAWSVIDRRLAAPGWRLEPATLASGIAVALGIAGVVLTAVESGGAAFVADKRVVVEAVGRGHLLWQMGGSLAVVLGWTGRRRIPALMGWLLLAGDAWLGFRYAFAITFIAVALLALGRPAPFRLGGIRLRHAVMILAGGLAVISYQNLKEPVRSGDWAEVRERVSNPLWWGAGIMTSEPFTTQTVLNEIVRNDFHTGTDHLWSAAAHLTLFSAELGDESVRFNALYQPALFPLVDHGLANNLWGQMWSAGGWPLLLVFVACFLAGLATWSALLRVPDPAVRSWAALGVGYFAFYAHRNELLTMVGQQKQLLVAWLACVVTAILVERIALRGRPVRTEVAA
jgi:hypothetical protein